MSNMLDIHNHSRFSFDSKACPKEEVEEAIKKGISVYGFAEHVYLHAKSDFRAVTSQMQEYVRCVGDIKSLYPTIKVLRGVEYNCDKGQENNYKALSGLVDFDYVINSVHWVNGEDMYKDFFANRSVDQAYNLYFDEVLKSLNAEYEYQIVGHFGVLLKIGKQFTPQEYFTRYYLRIKEILTEIIKRNKVLEVNTSTGNIGVSVPNKEVLELYYHLGGRKISFGADAHAVQAVGRNIDIAIKEARKVGFEYATYYEKMQEKQYLL